MNDFWDRYDQDPSSIDNIYEREFGEELNPLNQLYQDDDDNDPFQSMHDNYNQQRYSQTQLDPQELISHSNSHSQTFLNAQLHSQSTVPIQHTNQDKNLQHESNALNGKNFELAKSKSSLQQIEMVNPVTTCFARVALIFGIILIISLSSNQGFSFILRLRLLSDEWKQCLLYIWLDNIDMSWLDLVIFVIFFLCFLFCFYFFSNRNFSIHISCWESPVTACFTARVATGIGIGFLFLFNIQRFDTYYQSRLRQYLIFLTNTGLECFFEFIICFMCYFCEIFLFWFCFYFFKLCNSIAFRITIWIYRKKIFGRGIKDR